MTRTRVLIVEDEPVIAYALKDCLQAAGFEVVGLAATEPMGRRNAGIIYGLGNLIENAVDYAKSKVTITAGSDGNSSGGVSSSRPGRSR